MGRRKKGDSSIGVTSESGDGKHALRVSTRARDGPAQWTRRRRTKFECVDKRIQIPDRVREWEWDPGPSGSVLEGWSWTW